MIGTTITMAIAYFLNSCMNKANQQLVQIVDSVMEEFTTADYCFTVTKCKIYSRQGLIRSSAILFVVKPF